MADLLGNALKILGSAPVVGGIAGNVLAGINQRAERKWQEEMYNKYNSPSALVRQYEEAGINPALMFGGSTPEMSTSSAAAPVDMSAFGSLPEMLGQLMQLKLLGSEQEGKELDNEQKRQNIRSSELDNVIKAEFGRLTAEANYNEILGRLNEIQSRADLNEYERKVIGPLREALSKAQSRGLNADAVVAEWKGNYMRTYNSDPDTPILQQGFTALLHDLNDPKSKINNPDTKLNKAGKKATQWRAEDMTD